MMKQSHNFLAGSIKRCISGLVLCVFTLVVGLVGFPSTSFAGEEDTTPANEAALGLGSGLLTFVYLPAKVVYAVLGGDCGSIYLWIDGG